MNDLFDIEETVLKRAAAYLDSIRDQEYCERVEYEKLMREYARILRLVKRMTKISDKTAVELNADKIDLLDKVNYDVLTGIYNRRYFEEELQEMIQECEEKGRKIGILMIDVDFFKQYNDSYGHSMGDVCLHKIAQTLKASLGVSHGFVARYGGEEFVAVLPDKDSAEIGEVAEAMRKALADVRIPYEKNVDKGYVTVSIGGYSIQPSSEVEKEYYVKCADIALYQSKQTGRDKFTLYAIEEG